MCSVATFWVVMQCQGQVVPLANLDVCRNLSWAIAQWNFPNPYPNECTKFSRNGSTYWYIWKAAKKTPALKNMLESKRYFTPPDCPVPYLVLNSLLPKWRVKGLRRKDGYLRLKCSIAVHLAKDWMQEEHFLRGLRLHTLLASLLKTGSRMTKEWRKEKLGEGTRTSRDVGTLRQVKK